MSLEGIVDVLKLLVEVELLSEKNAQVELPFYVQVPHSHCSDAEVFGRSMTRNLLDVCDVFRNDRPLLALHNSSSMDGYVVMCRIDLTLRAIAPQCETASEPGGTLGNQP